MVAGAAAAADAAAGHPLLDHSVVNFNGDHTVDLNAGIHKGLGLRDRAGHTVEDIPVCTIRLGQTVPDDADDDLVRNQIALVHECLRFETGLRAIPDCFSEDVPGGNGRDPEPLGQDFCLRALPRAGSSQQDQSHVQPPVISQGSRSSCASASAPRWLRRSPEQR